MKKLISIAMAVIMTLGLVACSSVAFATEKDEAEIRFKIIEDTYIEHVGRVEIVVDTYTGVLYLRENRTTRSFMTPLLNTDGSPMLWERWGG